MHTSGLALRARWRDQANLTDMSREGKPVRCTLDAPLPLLTQRQLNPSSAEGQGR